MLLIQLTLDENGEQNIKVLAVQTVSPFNYRTLSEHKIQKCYGR